MTKTQGNASAFTFEGTNEDNAPKAKSKIPSYPDLEAALAALPIGKNFAVKNSVVPIGHARVHVQRAAKIARKDGGKLVTRTDKDAGALRIYSV